MAGQRASREDTHVSVGSELSGLVVEALRWAPRDMSLTSVWTLATLDQAGPRRVTDLAVIQGVTQPSMTVLVRVLEREGLVERLGDPQDRRVSLIKLSAAGEQLVRDRRLASAASFARLIGELAPEESECLIAALPALQRLNKLAHEQDPTVLPSAQRASSANRSAT
jgi:DNA-binding MarR family transcriptional regulator